MLILKNGYYFSSSGEFIKKDILIDNGIISGIGTFLNQDFLIEEIDLEGKKIIPGFIDIHTHGAVGFDVMTASPLQLQEMAKYLASCGTTSFLATTITDEINNIYSAIEKVRKSSELDGFGATIEGVHVEGPYISPKQKGCHRVELMKTPDLKEYERFKNILGDKLKLHMTIAPEVDGALEFIKILAINGDTVSIGHSNADSSRANEAVCCGASIFTHLFNAMKGIHHREPGTAGIALTSEAFVELVCDGVHVHPEIVKLIYKVKGPDKIILVTDAMQAAGLGDGEYDFGGFNIRVVDGEARKEDGTLASSTLNLLKAVKNFMKFTGASLEEVINMASGNPAKAVGIYDYTGSIEIQKRADMVVLDEDLNIEYVFCKGRKTYDKYSK